MFAYPPPGSYLLPGERRVLRCRRHWAILFPQQREQDNLKPSWLEGGSPIFQWVGVADRRPWGR